MEGFGVVKKRYGADLLLKDYPRYYQLQVWEQQLLTYYKFCRIHKVALTDREVVKEFMDINGLYLDNTLHGNLVIKLRRIREYLNEFIKYNARQRVSAADDLVAAIEYKEKE